MMSDTIDDRLERLDVQKARQAEVAARPSIREIIAETAAETAKAMLPAGATTTDLSQAAAMAAIEGPGGQAAYIPLPRAPSAQFGPGVAIHPAGIDPRVPGRQRPEPRISEYEVSSNLRLKDRPVDFDILDQASQIDVIHRLIETKKAHLTSLDTAVIVSKAAVKKVMAETGERSPGRAEQIAYERYAGEIARLEQFWKTPDPAQEYDWPSWFGAAIDQQLKFDAVALWPQPNRDGTTHGFQVVSGKTIKPLRDSRGAVPQPPNVAYQQILYGFPRGDFVASTDGVAQEYMADRFVYKRRVVRPESPYGYSNVEDALSFVDLYLKRINWLRAEFTHGALPTTYGAVKDPGLAKDVTQLLAYETALNDALSGQTEERHQIRLFPDVELVVPPQMAEKYKSDLDEWLIKMLCMCFSVMPTEVGFSPKGALGGKGHAEGEESTTYRKSIRPDVVWWTAQINHLQQVYLGAPPEIEFVFLGWQQEDQAEMAKVDDLLVRGAQRTVNEARAGRGEPLLDIPQADMVLLQTSTGALPLTAVPMDGVVGGTPVVGIASDQTGTPDTADAPDAPAVPATPAPPLPGPTTAPASKAAEADQFLRYAKRRQGKAWRDFEFSAFSAPEAAALNKLARAGDLASVRDRLGKAKARQSRASLVARHAPAVAAATRGLWPTPAVIAAEWARLNTHTKAADPQRRTDAAALIARLQSSPDQLDNAMANLIRDGYALGVDDALDMLEDGEPPDEAGPRGSRLNNLLAATGATVLAGYAAARLTTALVNNRDAAGPVADVLDGLGPWAGTQVDAALTAPITQGRLATLERNQVERVRLVASEGDCDFCSSYDGRIMTLDDDSGFPPLHNFCTCDLEPL